MKKILLSYQKIKWWNFERELIQDMVNKKTWDSIDKLKEYFKNNNV